MTRKYTSLPYTELPVAEGNYGTDRLPIKYIVMHTMVGSWQSAANRFNTVGQQASSNYGVKLDGGIIAFLEEYYVPYTNGNYKSNQESITIEHEDKGDYNGPRTPELYATSAKLVKDICNFYNLPIDREHIKKHSEVSDKPTACPDSLDLDKIIALANGQEPASSILVPKTDFERLVTKSSNYDSFVTAGFPTVADVNKKINSMQEAISMYTAEKIAMQSQLASLNDQINRLTDEMNNQPVSHCEELKQKLGDIKTISYGSWLTWLQSRNKVRKIIG